MRILLVLLVALCACQERYTPREEAMMDYLGKLDENNAIELQFHEFNTQPPVPITTRDSADILYAKLLEDAKGTAELREKTGMDPMPEDYSGTIYEQQYQEVQGYKSRPLDTLAWVVQADYIFTNPILDSKQSSKKRFIFASDLSKIVHSD